MSEQCDICGSISSHVDRAVERQIEAAAATVCHLEPVAAAQRRDVNSVTWNGTAEHDVQAAAIPKRHILVLVVVELAQVGDFQECRLGRKAREGDSLTACERQSQTRGKGCLAEEKVQALLAASPCEQQVGDAVAVEVCRGHVVVRDVGVGGCPTQPEASGAIDMSINVGNGS